MALRYRTVITSEECKLIVEIGKIFSAIIYWLLANYLLSQCHTLFSWSSSITSEFYRTLLARSSTVLGLGSIVTIVCISFSQPIMWDVLKSLVAPRWFPRQQTSLTGNCILINANICIQRWLSTPGSGRVKIIRAEKRRLQYETVSSFLSI